MKRKIAIFMSAALALGSTVQGYAASFKDINDVPWEGAKTYINNVADAGLMVGDEDIKTGAKIFRARDSVTYCETMQLAYTLLNKSGNLKSTNGLSTKWSYVLSSYNIPSWAHEAIAYGLEYEILSLNDVQKFVDSKKNSVAATREGVAVIFGKALSSKYSVSQSATVDFNDKSSIASSSVPYVALLNQLNIMVGDSDKNFNAKKNINRAEMAVIVSNTNALLGTGSTQPPVNPTVTGKTIRGTVTKMESMGSGTYMLTVLAEQSMGFIGNDEVSVTVDGSSDNLKFSQLKQGDIVTVDYTGSKINKIIVNYVNPDLSSTQVKGIIDEVDNERIYINKEDGGTVNYALDPTLDIKLDNKVITLKTLIDEDKDGVLEATIYVNANNKVHRIEASTGTKSTIYGEIKELDSDTITIKKPGGGTKDYDISSSASIKLEKKESTISKINSAMKSDTIYVELYVNSSGRVTKLFASEDEPDGYNDGTSGLLTDLSDSTVKIKIGSKTKSFTLADSVTYRLNGSSSSNSKMKSAIKDEDVDADLTVNSSNKVTKIDASTDEGDVKGTLIRLTSDTIEIKKSGGSKKEYDLLDDDDVEYRLNGSDSTRTKVKKALDDDDDIQVTLTLNSKDKVTKVVARTDSDSSDTVKGELYSITKSSIKIKKSSSSSAKSYSYANKVIFRLDSKSADWDDLDEALDDDEDVTVTLTLNDDEEVTKVVATTDESNEDEIKCILTRLDKEELRMKKKSSGSTERYTLASSVTYKMNGKTSSHSKVVDLLDEEGELDVIIVLNSRDYVTRIDVDFDDDTTTVKGTLRDISSDEVDIRISSSKTEKYKFASTATYRLNGTSSTYSAVKRAYDNKDDDLNVTLTLNSSDRVKKIEVWTVEGSETVKGKLEFFTTDSRVKIGSNYYYLARTIKYTWKGSTCSQGDLDDKMRDDDVYVTATLNSSGDVTLIEANWK